MEGGLKIKLDISPLAFYIFCSAHWYITRTAYHWTFGYHLWRVFRLLAGLAVYSNGVIVYFRRLVYRKIMPKAERLSEKRTVDREAKLRGQRWNFEDNPSAEGTDPPIYQQATKRFIYFIYNPSNNFSRRTHVDRSSIFCISWARRNLFGGL